MGGAGTGAVGLRRGDQTIMRRTKTSGTGRREQVVGAFAGRMLAVVLAAGVAGACVATGGRAAEVSVTQTPTPKNLTLLGIESATVAPRGMVFGALTATNRRDGKFRTGDGSAEFGFGFGSAESGVGFQVGTVITSLTDALGDSGYFTVKASRRVIAGKVPTYLGLSVSHLGNWGNASGVDVAGTLVVTSFANIRFRPGGETFPIMVSLGGGTNTRKTFTHPGVFAGVGIGINRNLGASLAWSGDYFDLGAAFRVDGLPNVMMTAVINDVLDQRNARRVTGSLVWFLPNAFGG